MPEQQTALFRKFTIWLGVTICVLVLLPTVYGVLVRPENQVYLGLQYNIDDHMVYAGWMQQAIEGRLLFENRFTTAEQPGLTLHLYFLLLGWIAKVVGIPVAMHLGRIVFCFLSVVALGRLIEFVNEGVYVRKVALTLSTVGGGIGFLVWHTFGVALVKQTPEFLASPMISRLPADVWQPEGFFLFSAMTNSLFMVSAFLMIGTLVCALQAKTNRKAAYLGAVSFGLLMNIHSYDVLILGLTFVGFCVALVAAKQIETKWLLRMLGIGAGVIPFALWFVYVLKNDPVFQARAATETFSANYRSIVFGFILLVLLAIPVVLSGSKWNKAGACLLFALQGVLYYIAPQHLKDGYFMTPIAWVSCFGITLCGIYLLAKRDEQPLNSGLLLVLAWAMVGLIAPYFPALFQRKLMMMLGLPWGILAGVGLAQLLLKRERGQRNLMTSLGVIILGATGIQWFGREMLLMRSNVSNTTVHSVYLPRDIQNIIEKLRPLGGRATVAALPGIPAPRMAEDGQPVVDMYDTPVVPDFNPFFTGLAGSKTFAGHWSETPDYAKKRNEVTQLLLGKSSSKANELGITHIVLPVGSNLPLSPADTFGNVIYEGTNYTLVEVQ